MQIVILILIVLAVIFLWSWEHNTKNDWDRISSELLEDMSRDTLEYKTEQLRKAKQDVIKSKNIKAEIDKSFLDDDVNRMIDEIKSGKYSNPSSYVSKIDLTEEQETFIRTKLLGYLHAKNDQYGVRLMHQILNSKSYTDYQRDTLNDLSHDYKNWAEKQ